MKIFLIGFMGSGKTYWGKIWAENALLDFYDLDEEIESAEGMAVSEIFRQKDEAYFRNAETDSLKAFASKDNLILACGGGTPCFHNNMKWMNAHGTTVYLDASPQTIYNRVAAEKNKRPLIERIGDAELLSFIEHKLKEREPFYKQANIILPAEELTDQTISSLITHNL